MGLRLSLSNNHSEASLEFYLLANQVVKERIEEEKDSDLIIEQFTPGPNAAPDNKNPVLPLCFCIQHRRFIFDHILIEVF